MPDGIDEWRLPIWSHLQFRTLHVDLTAAAVTPAQGLFDESIYGVYPWIGHGGAFLCRTRFTPGAQTDDVLAGQPGVIPLAVRAQYMPIEFDRWCIVVNTPLGMLPAGSTPWYTVFLAQPKKKPG